MNTFKNQRFMDSKFSALSFLLLCFLFLHVNTFTSFGSCNSTSQYYNYLTFTCNKCPTGSLPDANKTTCYCNGVTSSYYPNRDVIGSQDTNACKNLGISPQPDSNQTITIYNKLGAFDPKITNCSIKAIPDKRNFQCIPCSQGTNMQYDKDLGICMCINTTSKFYPIDGFCYQDTNNEFTNLLISKTDKVKYLTYMDAYVGCKQRNIVRACQHLVNRCVKALYNSTNEYCALIDTFLKLSNKPSSLSFYKFQAQPEDSLNIYASSRPGTNLTNIKHTLGFILIEFHLNGTVNDIKPLDESVMPCVSNDEDVVKFKSFGLFLYKTCVQYYTKSTQYYYDVYVLDSSNQYNEVPVKYGQFFYKRFTPTSALNAINLEFYNVPPLKVPVLVLPNVSAAIANITTISKAGSTSVSSLIPLIVFLVLSVIIFVYNFYRYMRYNPDENNDPYFCFKALFFFIAILIKHLSVGMWFYLLGLSGYVFCFYKFQQTVLLVLPDVVTEWGAFYEIFMIIFYLQCGLMLATTIGILVDVSTTTDYFLIDWEKDKNIGKFDIKALDRVNLPGGGHGNRQQASVWRKVLLVNELYELSVYRVVNMQFVMLLSVVFLQGLGWINTAYPIPNLDFSAINTINTAVYGKNAMLAYFILTFIIFIIGLLQYLIRIFLRTWIPMPYENFVDLCSICNISLIVFDETLHGYYLHGMNPLGQAQGSLDYIESVFQKQAKAFGKTRAFKSDDPEQCQNFEVIFPFQIRKTFQMKYKDKYLAKLMAKQVNTSVISKPIPDVFNEEDYRDIDEIQNSMVESFKFYLEGVKTSKFNVKERSFLQNILNWPVDVDTMGRLPIFFKDYWNGFTNILLSGHQLVLLFNFINFVNLFYIATKSTFIGIFITAIIFRVIVKNVAQFMLKRNLSKNTMLDDKFFN